MDDAKYDLTGRKFGKLTAVKRAEGEKSKAVWECECECGSAKRASYHDLTQGRVQSCGCGRASARDLTGQRFGRLTAIENTGEKKSRCYVWRCRCDCGKETLATSNALLSGNTQSCGCLQQAAKRAQYRDIAGQRFGRLTAICAKSERSGGSVMWKCRCDCGRESVHSAKALLSGRARSCGCLKRENDALQRSLHYISDTCVEFIEDTGKLRADNTSGCRGLKLVRGKWQVRIGFQKKSYYLGSYEDKEEAVRVRRRAEEAVYGEFLEWYAEQFPEMKTRKQKEQAQRDDG